MKAKEVLQALGISRRTLSRYCTKGILKYTIKYNGQYDYDEESVRALAPQHKRSLFEIMLKVCDLGLLKANKVELARLEGFKVAYEMMIDGELQINNDGIKARIYIGPNKLSDWFDDTIDVLSMLYEPTDKEWEDYDLDTYFYEKHCYLKKLKGE